MTLQRICPINTDNGTVSTEFSLLSHQVEDAKPEEVPNKSKSILMVVKTLMARAVTNAGDAAKTSTFSN